MVIVLSETADCKKPSRALQRAVHGGTKKKDLLGEKPAREEEFPAHKKEPHVIIYQSEHPTTEQPLGDSRLQF